MTDRSEGIGILSRISDADYAHVLYFLKKISMTTIPYKGSDGLNKFDAACESADSLIEENPWKNEEEMIAELSDKRRKKVINAHNA